MHDSPVSPLAADRKPILQFPTAWIDRVGWVLLFVAMTFAIYGRIRLRDFPLERDEGEFAYAGQLILEGVPPYRLAYNMKLPGTYLAYAGLMGLFGQSIAGIHIGLLFVNLATIILLFRLTREVSDSLSAGAAAIAYSILSFSPYVLGMAAHATHFIAFFGVAGTLLLWKHFQSGRWWTLFFSGLLIGTAFLMKQQAVFLMVFGGAIVALHYVRRRPFSWRKLLAGGGIFTLAAILPYLAVCLWLWRAGVFDTFWFWTYLYAKEYVDQVPLKLAPTYFWFNVQMAIGPNWPFLLLALVGLVALAFRGRGKPGLRPFLYGFLVFSFFCVCPGFYFRSHYFIVMLPAVAIFAGLGARELWNMGAAAIPWRRYLMGQDSPEQSPPTRSGPVRPTPARHKRRSKGADHVAAPARGPQIGHKIGPRIGILAAPAVLIYVAVIGWTLSEQANFFFVWSPDQACHMVYSLNPFVESTVIAKYLKKNCEPDDTIAVLGSEPQIYFYTHQKSATGYIYTYGLMENQPFALKMQQEMIHEIEESKPKFIVYANVYFSWLDNPNSHMDIFEWKSRYLNEHYQLVGLLDFASSMNPEFMKDEALARYQPIPVEFIPDYIKHSRIEPRLPDLLVYRRKP